ncbi:cupin domain-containing protein [Zavarzinia compransoris]|uniref:Cupin type-2 domain-containing protein n=1 Tax=Zavarzinia compransoris TaxID=1264899 RepID=A0A317DYY5_9PROT|nr:cupin domain-containing protein [Zavarzinia compransoris]PWR19988.1 hypothetical protein DKG75_16215 [Zavarzinia compransoris]TDP44897.1 cupin domain [Zavarzinia compransoris]
MKPRPPVGTRFDLPGFSGRITGWLGDNAVIEARVTGEIPGHAAAADEFALVIEGSIVFEAAGMPAVTLGPGDHRVVPAGVYHSGRATGEARLILIGPLDP